VLCLQWGDRDSLTVVMLLIISVGDDLKCNFCDVPVDQPIVDIAVHIVPSRVRSAHPSKELILRAILDETAVSDFKVLLWNFFGGLGAGRLCHFLASGRYQQERNGNPREKVAP